MGEGGGAESDEREAPRVLASGPTITYPLPAGLDLHNLTVVLTGGTSGLGLEAGKMLCAKNAHVVLLGDNFAKGRQALREVQAAVPKARVDLFECDLSSLKSVHTCAGALRSLGLPLHVLCLNAGAFLPPYRKTADGFEQTMAIFLGHFYLAHLLLPELQAATPARIIWQGSAFEQLGTVPWGDLGGEFARDSDVWQYSNAKLCSVMAAREMARRLKGTGVDVFACHPGLVNTELYSKTDTNKPGSWLFSAAARLVGQSPTRGAYSLVYAAGAPELDGKGGALIGPPYLGPFSFNFFNTARLTPLNPRAHSAESCRRLYDEAVHLLERKTGSPLPHKLPGAYREHPWQESAAGKDRAHPVDTTLEPRQPPYWAHGVAASIKQSQQQEEKEQLGELLAQHWGQQHGRKHTRRQAAALGAAEEVDGLGLSLLLLHRQEQETEQERQARQRLSDEEEGSSDEEGDEGALLSPCKRRRLRQELAEQAAEASALQALFVLAGSSPAEPKAAAESQAEQASRDSGSGNPVAFRLMGSRLRRQKKARRNTSLVCKPWRQAYFAESRLWRRVEVSGQKLEFLRLPPAEAAAWLAGKHRLLQRVGRYADELWIAACAAINQAAAETGGPGMPQLLACLDPAAVRSALFRETDRHTLGALRCFTRLTSLHLHRTPEDPSLYARLVDWLLSMPELGDLSLGSEEGFVGGLAGIARVTQLTKLGPHSEEAIRGATQLTALSRLCYLSLGSLDGAEAPLPSLFPELEEFVFYGNCNIDFCNILVSGGLGGAFPAAVLGCTSLRHLVLIDQGLSSLPEGRYLKRLRALDLSRNQLAALPPG
ncbi:hypothetical protein ABPG75_002976 [Micractinium tetrahymenae]